MTGPRPVSKTWLNGLLFALTGVTVWVAGLFWSADFSPPASAAPADFVAFLVWLIRQTGLYPLAGLYSVALLTVLIGHEAGHYLACRRYRLPATLPYFLPGLPPLGTFGAFIRIKSPFYFKRQAFDVGISGPLAGFALTVPILAAGLVLSKVVPAVSPDGALIFSEPLLFKLMSSLVLPPIPAGSRLLLHPVGWAGWVGLLVTSFNLVPIGQFDGGHVAYALLGRRARLLSRAVLASMAALGLFFHLTWLFLAVILLVIELRTRRGLDHPAVLDEGAPLGRGRTILAAAIVVVFALSFMPAPVHGYGLVRLLHEWTGLF